MRPIFFSPFPTPVHQMLPQSCDTWVRKMPKKSVSLDTRVSRMARQKCVPRRGNPYIVVPTRTLSNTSWDRSTNDYKEIDPRVNLNMGLRGEGPTVYSTLFDVMRKCAISHHYKWDIVCPPPLFISDSVANITQDALWS